MTRLSPLLVAVILATVAPALAQTPSLPGTEWGPDEAAAAEHFVRFESDGRLSGSAGCNRYTGSWERDGARLSIGPLATTRMVCPPEVMDEESAFLSALESVRGIGAVDPLVLVLVGEDGEPLLSLQRRDVE